MIKMYNSDYEFAHFSISVCLMYFAILLLGT